MRVIPESIRQRLAGVGADGLRRYTKVGLPILLGVALIATPFVLSGETPDLPDGHGDRLVADEGASADLTVDTSVVTGVAGTGTNAQAGAGTAKGGRGPARTATTRPGDKGAAGAGTSAGGDANVGSGGGTGGGSGGEGDGGGGGSGGDGAAPGTGGPPEAYQGPRCTAFKGCDNTNGITDKEVRVGVVYTKQTATCGPGGQFPICFGDPRAQSLALEDDINRRNPGGIHGRKLKVELYPPPGSEQAPPAETETEREQRLCRGFVDQKVFAVLTHWAGRVLAHCLAQNQILLLRTGNLIGDDAALAATSPWAWTPPDKSNNRFWAALLPSLKEQGYFAGENKIGLVVQTDPAYAQARSFVVAKLKEYGITDIDTFEYTASGQSFDFAALAAAGSGAAQQFRVTGRNKVMFIPSFLVIGAFMKAAEGNGGTDAYRPRYALDSTMALNGPMELGVPPGSSIPKQMRDSIGIGWKRGGDVSGNRAGPYTARETACFAAMKAGGVTIVDRTNPSLASQHCEAFYAFEEAAKRAGSALTSGTLVAGLQATGAWDSVMSFGVDFGRSRTDGSFGHRRVKYVCQDGACSKGHFEYDGPERSD